MKAIHNVHTHTKEGTEEDLVLFLSYEEVVWLRDHTAVEVTGGTRMRHFIQDLRAELKVANLTTTKR